MRRVPITTNTVATLVSVRFTWPWPTQTARHTRSPCCVFSTQSQTVVNPLTVYYRHLLDSRRVCSTNHEYAQNNDNSSVRLCSTAHYQRHARIAECVQLWTGRQADRHPSVL